MNVDQTEQSKSSFRPARVEKSRAVYFTDEHGKREFV